MQSWLSSLPANTVVDATGDCIQVSGLYFLDADGLTINGGTWIDAQAPTSSTTLTSANLQAVWYFEDGTDITLENLTVAGVNTCACDYDNGAAAFQSGIRSDGTDGLTLTNDTVEDVYGDGLTLDGGSAGPTTNASVDGLTISGVGRQGVTLASVNDSTLADITITNPAEDDFDAESDLTSQGINGVTINGCTVSGNGRIFFANDGQGGGNLSGTNSGDDVIENCTMENAQTGDVIEDQTPSGLGVRGPFTFSNDVFDCGTSAFVGCVDLIGADVTIVDSTLTFPADAYYLYREVWTIDPTSTLIFQDDTVNGYSSENYGNTCDVTITGGTWTADGSASPATPLTCVSTSSPASPLPPASPAPPDSPAPPASPLPLSTGHGYWLVGSDGGIFTFGQAKFYGSTGSLTLQRPVVGITPSSSEDGYWLVASDGGIFAFNVPFVGSLPSLGLHPAGSGLPNSLNEPIVGLVPSANGKGYYMVASDGGVFAFNASFAGSCPGIGGCSGAAVAVAPDASGDGYWIATATGHVYAFGDAPYFGAPGPQSSAITSMVRTPDGGGYWLLDKSGQIFAYGDAAYLGSPTGSTGASNPATAIFATSDGDGYWVASANGSVFNYGDAANDGSMAGTHLNGAIVAATGF
jgi:hypothetical protein